jgi:hypothetical protein
MKLKEIKETLVYFGDLVNWWQDFFSPQKHQDTNFSPKIYFHKVHFILIICKNCPVNRN